VGQLDVGVIVLSDVTRVNSLAARHALGNPIGKFQPRVPCLMTIVTDADRQYMQPDRGCVRYSGRGLHIT
jgi:hypothetical protein